MRLKGQQKVVMIVDFVGAGVGHFNVLVPGGGVGDNTHGCTVQRGADTQLGEPDGGLLAACQGNADCVRDRRFLARSRQH